MGAVSVTTGVVFVPTFPEWLTPLPPPELKCTSLTEDQMIEIKRLITHEGWTQTAVARHLNLSLTVVHKYARASLNVRVYQPSD